MLEEMGQPYELVETSAHPDDVQTREYLQLNPNGRIPTLVDGELVLWESLAINLYLAQKYEGPLHAGSPEVVAQVTQWSLWAVLEIEELERQRGDRGHQRGEAGAARPGGRAP
jgi:glutathione S-transferase